MGKARDERDELDRREMVGNIRGDMRAMFAQANVMVSRPARPSRFAFDVSRFTVS